MPHCYKVTMKRTEPGHPVCQVCGAGYIKGGYNFHKRTSQIHARALGGKQGNRNPGKAQRKARRAQRHVSQQAYAGHFGFGVSLFNDRIRKYRKSGDARKIATAKRETREVHRAVQRLGGRRKSH